MYKTVKATAMGTVATSVGILHFDPKREDEDGRYLGMILPAADAAKVERRELGKITGDATKAEFDKQQAGYGVDLSRIREIATDAIAEASEAEEANGTTLLGASAAASTTNIRNFPAGEGPEGVTSGADPDAAPIPGQGGAGASEAGASTEKTETDADKAKAEKAAKAAEAAKAK